MHKLFINRKTRDAEFKRLQSEGYNVSRYSTRNQLLHPQYVEDYEKETGVTLTHQDMGFGNTIYKTHFSVLYGIQ